MNTTTSQQTSAGGRLTLINPAELDGDQRKLYDWLADNVLAGSNELGVQADDVEGCVVGPFNAMLRSPVFSQASLDFATVEQKHTSLGKKVREVVILTVGAVWNSAYELYAHSAVGHKAGLDEAAIIALAGGQTPTALLLTDELMAHEFTRRLVAEHQVDQELYQRVVATFGEKGVLDMIYLAGNYITNCALLNAFVVPVPSAR